MERNMRLPSYPLLVNDPYFSVWSPADDPALADTVHWSGASLPVKGTLTIDGQPFRFLGLGEAPELSLMDVDVTPTATTYHYEQAGIRMIVRFWTAALPEEPDLFSIPVSLIEFALNSTDGVAHDARIRLWFSSRFCYDGDEAPEMLSDKLSSDDFAMAMMGQVRQKLLCHSGDHVTIDWGYLYLASREGVDTAPDGLVFHKELTTGTEPGTFHVQVGYDDVASIVYFGTPCKAWYAREGKTLPQAMRELERTYDELVERCRQEDEKVLAEARALGGEDYALIVTAAWRQVLAAHKLIATPKGEMALISKENDSNGCAATVDVSYPSIPFFLKYNPRLVNALCLPVLEFASMPVWKYDFAPHDVGRYPIVGGQMYARRLRLPDRKAVYPPWYLYPAEKADEIYEPTRQMPVEECGNMLIMLYAAARFTGDFSLIHSYKPLLEKWVQYLVQFGDDPEDQLCTDDFAGHLAHNVNLSAKAIIGINCFSQIQNEEGSPKWCTWHALSHSMIIGWMFRCIGKNLTPLTFDGEGWSMKYNIAWDYVLDLHMVPEECYVTETRSYLKMLNRYGLPLDSRKEYTKSDWILWTATMMPSLDDFRSFIAPVARYLRETPTRVPFSDWYDTKTGESIHFIARSVQGGVFMPMLRRWGTRDPQQITSERQE